MSRDTFYIPEMGGDSQQQSTTIEIENPEHPRNIPHRHEVEQAAGYEAALWAKKAFNGEREMLVCAFLAAVQHEAKTGEPMLDQLVKEIRQQIE